jgi:hypothetical protein
MPRFDHAPPRARGILSLCLLAVLIMLRAPAVRAADEPPHYSAEKLDELVAPVALYPDPILSQVMTASTFPDQVKAASEWSTQHKNVQGDALAQAMADANLDWDPSVQALVPFPSVLETMTRDSGWLIDFGNAVLAQRGDTMDSVQRMRKKAQDAGNLTSSEYIKVENTSPTVIEIQPANPQVIYVPTYDPAVVYAPPPPSASGNAAAAAIFAFAAGVMVAEVFDDDWYGGCGFYWSSHTVVVHHSAWGCTWVNRYTYHPPYPAPRNVYVDRDVNINTGDINIGNEVNIGGGDKVNIKGGDKNVNIQGGDRTNIGSGNKNIGASDKKGAVADKKAGVTDKKVAGADQGKARAPAAAQPQPSKPSAATAQRGYKQNPQAKSTSAMSGIQNGKAESTAGKRGKASTGGKAPAASKASAGKASSGSKARPAGGARGGR